MKNIIINTVKIFCHRIFMIQSCLQLHNNLTCLLDIYIGFFIILLLNGTHCNIAEFNCSFIQHQSKLCRCRCFNFSGSICLCCIINHTVTSIPYNFFSAPFFLISNRFQTDWISWTGWTAVLPMQIPLLRTAYNNDPLHHSSSPAAS